MSEYKKTQDKILELCKEIRFIDVDSFLSQLNSADSVGAMLDPTMYRAAMGNLQVVKESALAIKKAQDSLPDLAKVIDGAIAAQNYRGGDL